MLQPLLANFYSRYFSLHVSKTDLSNASVFHFCFKFPVFRCCLLTSCKADGLASSVPFCRDFWPDAPLPVVCSWKARCPGLRWAAARRALAPFLVRHAWGFPAVGGASPTRLWGAARSLCACLCASSGGLTTAGFSPSWASSPAAVCLLPPTLTLAGPCVRPRSVLAPFLIRPPGS